MIGKEVLALQTQNITSGHNEYSYKCITHDMTKKLQSIESFKAVKARPISEYTPRKTGAFQSEQEEINAQRLAYIDYKPINRCPHCKTGLANEDLEDGKCERCGNEVEQRPMKQRVLRITKYAERLLSGLEHLNRDENMKELERNWIGKSSGTEFKMQVKTEKES